ncbi:MAG: PhzF family phenazine biosynthesis protein [Paludibacteraceae bacterium]|nr:PhzF family phenazine biosynthesis protein [Paludibacteraceae bacterium]
MKQYIVDAFTEKVFHGNPAAVCVLPQWPEEKLMMQIAMENNLSETAFVVKESGGYHLRWFTPTCEVGLCGHATLASGFVVLNYYEQGADSVTFSTKGGDLTVGKKGEMYEMRFPNIPLERVRITEEMFEALGTIPVDARMGKDLDLICVLQDAEQVKSFIPYADSLKRLPGRMVHITAPGTDGYDCCSRCFGPKLGILEDPVCGSAHCQIVPYWAQRLHKNVINAWEASPRGGELQGEIVDETTIILRGKAVLFAEAEISLN